MNEVERRAQIRRYREYTVRDQDIAHEIYHDDAILEFRGDKVARETIYVTEPWDAPEWRAPWRAEP
jgi:hypothetical protein